MHEVGRINSLNEVPDNISRLFLELKEYEENFNIRVEYKKDRYKFTLSELIIDKLINRMRCILIKISNDPCWYSIHLFNRNIYNSSSKNFKQIYEIVVEGKNDFRLIMQDVKHLIEGQKEGFHSSNYPL